MPCLKLSLLGPFAASLDDQPIYHLKTNKVQGLLIYLSVERDHPHQREALMTLLWPDMPLESAQVNLRQTLYRLRQAIPEVNHQEKDQTVPLLLTDRQTVQINPAADLHSDLDEFQAQIESNPTQALALYRGDFLADFFLSDSNAFEDWAERIRENLRRKALQALDDLTNTALQLKDYEQAQNHAWRQLEIDNLRESAYRQLMRALAKAGQRNAALSQYRICQERLEEGLGVSPSQETTALYKRIQSDALRQTGQYTLQELTGTRHEMPVFVLTDIEGSTRLWDRYHQAMLPALLQHNKILEEQISRHGGRILELRGDGVKAVFEGGEPLACMLAIQKELGLADWGEIGELKIRIGLHGVPAARKGYDYFKKDDKYYGPVLNHTARIMDSGWGGQILVSEQVRNAFSLVQGANWHDFGYHKVKSLDEPIKIFGLVHPDLPHQSFPALRTLTSQTAEEQESPISTLHNIEKQPTHFVGRQNELAALNNLLSNPEIRLVTIVGPGGMGKTRLAIAAAEKQIERASQNGTGNPFTDGIYFIPLAPLSSADQIIPTIAKNLRIHIEPSRSGESPERTVQAETDTREKLLGYLEEKKILLILDNFEHLLEGAEILTEILQAAPGVKFLGTSRERLHIREEQIFPIQGLEFPEWEAPEDPCDYTAMELFLQSAQRVLPDFELKSGDMEHLTRICNLVGGMPLGLELAASWVDMLSLKDITEEIRKNLDFLETDVRNIPDRHRSMRAVFDSSWNRLSETEKQIFPIFSVLRGSFSRAAAQKVAGASIRHLASFVSKSLVSYNQESDCYQVHELLRQYGEEQLKNNPDQTFQALDRHSRYYCEEVMRHMDTFISGQSHLAFEQMGTDISNIQRAWTWAIEHENLDSIDKAINGLCIYYRWEWSGENGLKLCNQVIDMLSKPTAAKSKDQTKAEYILTQRVHVKALTWLGFFCLFFDHDKAKSHFDQSQDILDHLVEAGADVRNVRAWLLYFQGIFNHLSGENEAAKKFTQESLSLSEETGFHWMAFSALELMGDISRQSGSPREAKIWYEKYLIEARAKKNPSGEIRALNNLGWAARHMFAYDEAKLLYQESLKLAQSYDNPTEEISILQSLGFLSIFLGTYEQAIQYFTKAIKIANKLGAPHRTISCYKHVGFSQMMMGNFEQAERPHQEIIKLVEDKGDDSALYPIMFYAEYLIMRGQYREANAQHQIAKVLSKNFYLDRFIQGRLTRNCGWIALAERNYAQAKTEFEQSVHLYQINADDEQVAWSQAGLARADIGLGQWDTAKTHLMDALWTSIEMRAFIPLVFTLPMAVLYLAREDPSHAVTVYQQMQSSPFLANAKFFKDIVDQYLPDDMKNLPRLTFDPQADPRPTLWAAASSIMFKWMQLWMEETETIEKYQEY